MEEILRVISEEMERLNIPYEFAEWTKPVQYPYFVGEIIEIPTEAEDGIDRFSFILSGFTRGRFLDLILTSSELKKEYPATGKMILTEAGEGVAIYYDYLSVIDTAEPDLKRTDIYFSIFYYKNRN